ncbi:hypothetical protein, partial [Limnospira platensis]
LELIRLSSSQADQPAPETKRSLELIRLSSSQADQPAAETKRSHLEFPHLVFFASNSFLNTKVTKDKLPKTTAAE